MKKNITDRFCQTVKTKAGRREYVDTSPNSWNLVLRVTPTAKSWAVRYRLNGLRQRRTLGTFPSVSLKDARAESVRIGGLVQKGVDPVAAEKESRAASMSFEELIREYIDDYCKRHQKSWKQVERIFENWIIPRIGSCPILELDRGKVLGLLHDVEQEGLNAQVNRILAQVKACLSWGVEEREYLKVNPVATLYRRKKRVVEQSRERVLSDAELKDLWKATGRLSDPSRSFVRMLMLTGQRRDEVRLMTWEELDLDKAEWLLSAPRTKAKREHLIHLSKPAVKILESLSGKDGYVFTVNGRRPYFGQKRLKEILNRESKVSDWVFHDLRRTFATGLGQLRIPDKHIRLCLNHATGAGITGVYNRHKYIEEKRDAFDAWASHLMVTVGERKAENVVSMTG